MNNEPASPVCHAAQADDMYMGYAGKDEIAAVLNELLEAERASVRIVLKGKSSPADPATARLMAAIDRDAIKWCALLASQIKRIGAIPSRRRGACDDQAITITDAYERLSVLTRVQVRKLGELIPRVRDDALHATLSEMKARHVENILLTEQCISLWASQAG
jgi:hypothetical protein